MIQIRCLMDDQAGNNACQPEHGLCFYVKTQAHKLLVDTGASDTSWANADLLGIDPSEVDSVFLTHGHYDHTGGLAGFFARNEKATAYIRDTASYAYYNHKPEGLRYIGMAEELKEHPRLHYLSADFRLDEEVSVFGHVTQRRLWPRGNLHLLRKVGDDYINDCFDHEQYIVVEAEGKRILFGGCAHAGILNILECFRKLYGAAPDWVFSGFHMMKSAPYDEADKTLILQTAEALKDWPCAFYTGHCSSHEAYLLMKPILKDQLQEFHSGDSFTPGS